MVVEPVSGAAPKACFDHLARAIGGPAPEGRAEARLWMNGRSHVAAVSRDVEVLVLPATETTQSAGTSANPGGTQSEHHYTHVFARIDPPLFVGLQLELQRPIEIFGKMPSIATGDPRFDGSFLLNARAANLAVPMFRRVTAPPNDLVDHLFAIVRQGTVDVSDTYVHVKTSFTDEPAALAPRIASATALAAFLASRRAPLPRDAGEQAAIAPWRACAASEQLALDDARIALSGVVEGSRIRLSVESEGTELFTALTIVPPRSLDLGLSLSKQGALQFIAGIFGSQDIRIGDELFDKAFVIKGKNEAGVKALFQASPAARQALVELLSQSPDLVLHDGGFFARWPSLANESTLRRTVPLAKTIAAALAPAPAHGRAYR